MHMLVCMWTFKHIFVHFFTALSSESKVRQTFACNQPPNGLPGMCSALSLLHRSVVACHKLVEMLVKSTSRGHRTLNTYSNYILFGNFDTRYAHHPSPLYLSTSLPLPTPLLCSCGCPFAGVTRC